MAPLPQKPRVIRPPELPCPEVSGACAPPVRKRKFLSGTALMGSLGIHACLIAAACAMAMRDATGTGSGNDDLADEGGGVVMTLAAASSQTRPAEDQPQQPTAPPLFTLPPAIRIPEPTPVLNLPAQEPLAPVSLRATGTEAPAASASPGADSSRSAAETGSGTAKSSGRHGHGEGHSGKHAEQIAPPKLVHAPPPLYPARAKLAGKSGQVAVLVRVRGDGSAEATSVYQSSGNRDLDQAALHAAAAWRFSQTPALGPENTVAVVVRVTFSL